MVAIHDPLTEKISLQVAGQLPDFVQNDHPEFITFMEKYYQFLEQQGEAYEVIGNFLQYKDVDKTIASVEAFFKNQFAIDIPEKILVDKNFLIKNIREFYRSRGSEKSFQYLFRILFDDDITFRFPSLELLRTSDGKWTQPVFIKSANFLESYRTIQGRKITGTTSNATAIVNLVIKLGTGETRLQLIKTIGTFVAGETVSGVNLDGDTINIVLTSLIDKVNITASGSLYQVQDIVTFNPATTGSGTIQAVVESLTTGTVDDVTITSGGTGYTTGEYLSIDNTDKFFGADAHTVIAKISGVSQELTRIDIVSPSQNYIVPPRVLITGGGTPTIQATARAIINTLGEVVNIEITNRGLGYTIVPTVELIPQGNESFDERFILNGELDANSDNWVDVSTGDASISYNNIRNALDITDTATSEGLAEQRVVGMDTTATYIIAFEVKDQGASGVGVRVSTTSLGTDILNKDANLLGFVKHDFAPTVSNPYITLTAAGLTSNDTVTVDNISIFKTELTNSTFTFNITGWTDSSSGGSSISWGSADPNTLDLNKDLTGEFALGGIQMSGADTTKSYSIEINITDLGTSILSISAGLTGLGLEDFFSNITTTGIHKFTFTPSIPNEWINVGVLDASVSSTVKIDYIIVTESASAEATISSGASAGIIQSVDVETGGKSYIRMPLFSDPVGTAGSGLNITGTTSSISGIKKINILNHGVDVTDIPNVDLSTVGDGLATGVATIGAMIVDEFGLWTNSDGFLDSDKVLQDNLFFQDYSYVIKTSISFQNWEDVVTRIAHPAGTKLFGQISTETSIGVTVVSSIVDAMTAPIDFILTPPGEVLETIDMKAKVIPILTFTVFAELKGDLEVGLGTSNKSVESHIFFTEGGSEGMIQYYSNDTIIKYIDQPAVRRKDALNTFIDVYPSIQPLVRVANIITFTPTVTAT